VIEPLKKLKDGEPCKRPPKIESKLLELDGLSNAELIRRSEIVSPTDPGFIPAECLVYLVRSRRGCDPSDSTFEQLYTALFKRVLAQLPREPVQDGRGEAGLESEVRSIVTNAFAMLMVNDRQAGYDDRLDVYEYRFAMAVANLRKSAYRQVCSQKNRATQIASFEEDLDLSDRELEQLTYGDLAEFERFGDKDYRMELNAAINRLPDIYRTALELYRREIPVETTNENAISISKAIGRTPKTTREYLKKAIATVTEMTKECTK
jgi:DNA-directed RNA polymerase specialized sigma24 family protein